MYDTYLYNNFERQNCIKIMREFSTKIVTNVCIQYRKHLRRYHVYTKTRFDIATFILFEMQITRRDNHYVI